ncbi:MAG: MarR family transcriptional regulator [Spirochaetales bacterium]|nr:MAG: MarR family transcriptional regulator [Spirochaetales bacterium]
MRKEFEGVGITMPQGMILGVLFQEGPRKISDLSKALSLSNSTVSGIVDRLEKQNIVERVRTEEDRRIVVVHLTPAFGELHRNFHKRIGMILEKTLNTAAPADIATIFRGLRLLKKLLEDQRE